MDYLLVGVAVFIVLLFVFQRRRGRSLSGPVKGAQKVYAGPHEFRRAATQEFPDVDLAFYDQTQAWLERHGFRCLGDVEDTTASQAYPNMRTFLRVLLSNDGTVMAACYHINLRGWMKVLQWIGLLPRVLKVLDLETEFNDGTFLATSNSEGLDMLSEVPGHRKVQFPQATAFDEMIEVHRSILAQWGGADSTYQPLRLSSLDDVLAAQNRSQQIASEYRQKIGYISKEEMARMAGGTMTVPARQLLSEFHKVRSGELEVEKPPPFEP